MKVSLKVVVAFGISLVALAGCKARDSLSGTKDNGGLTVTDKALMDNSTNLNTTVGAANYIELDVPSPGFVDVNLSFSSVSPFTKPIDISVYDQANQSSPVLSGVVQASANYPGYISADISFHAKQAGPLFILVDHKGQMNPGSSGQVYATFSQVTNSTGPTSVIFPANTNESTTIQNGEVSLQLSAAKSMAQLQVSLDMRDVKNKIVDSSGGTPSSACPGCSVTMIFSDVNKDYSYVLPVQNPFSIGADVLVKLVPRTYNIKFKFVGYEEGTPVNIYVGADHLKTNIGNSFIPGAPMGMLNLSFDQNNSKMAVHGGKDFGYFVNSDRISEAKINLDLHVFRALNGGDQRTLPTSLGAKLAGPTNYNNVVADIDLKSQFQSSYSTSVIADIVKGKYRLLFNKGVYDKDDILQLNGNMLVVDLTVPEGGPDISTFTDVGAVTTTPPNNYLVDLKVTNQPHTPAAAPIDLASKSVLEGMEIIRKKFHVRLPKGSKRGPTNTIDADTIEACLSNAAEHWSDIMIHYYCQLGQARACYTGTLKSTISAIANDLTLSQPDKVKKLQTVRTTAWKTCAATAASDPEWEWIVKNQGDVFQYVMNSQTFAFDDAQQQAVINKFYRVNDPTDKSECNLKRPRRNIDPTDGTHCMPKKIYNPPMTSVGR